MEFRKNKIQMKCFKLKQSLQKYLENLNENECKKV